MMDKPILIASQEQLQMIETAAANFFRVEEIALLCDLDAEQLRQCLRIPSSEVNKAYRKGTLKSQMDLRNAMIKANLAGTADNSREIMEFIAQQRDSEF